jgi:hypothetical protein
MTVTAETRVHPTDLAERLRGDQKASVMQNF